MESLFGKAYIFLCFRLIQTHYVSNSLVVVSFAKDADREGRVSHVSCKPPDWDCCITYPRIAWVGSKPLSGYEKACRNVF